MRYIPENTYSINDHEETLKNETAEPKDSEGSDRSEITVRKEFFDMRWDKCIGYFKFNSKIHSASWLQWLQMNFSTWDETNA